MSINFVIETFNYQLEMGVSGELFEIPIPVLDTSANAEYYVSVDAMKNAFYFQTDSRDVSDLSGDDLKYYVNWPAHVVLNPCHAYVSTNAIASTDATGTIPDNRQLVKHDFIRHIAKDLFNTHLGVDLFQNEQELKDDLASKGHSQAWGSILSDINAVSISNTDLSGADASGEYYTTNALDTSNNLCRELLGQVISSAPSRLYDLSAIALNGNLALEKFSIPFQNGDSISFKLTLSAAPNQHLLVGKATAVPDRTYRIRLNIVDTVNGDSTTHSSGTNVIVNDCVSNTSLNNSRVISTIPAGYQAVETPTVTTTSTTSVNSVSLNGASMFVPGSTGDSTVKLTESSTPPPESTFVSIPSVQIYLKLEPVGAVFTNHISIELSVAPGTELSLFFKKSTDPEPVLIPLTNTSANDVYYTYVQETGIITLYTKHFSEVFVTDPLPPQVDIAQSTITLSGGVKNYTMPNGTVLNSVKTIVNSNAQPTYEPLSNIGLNYGSNQAVYTHAIDSNNNIYIGGNFTYFNGTAANRIVKYNPTTNTLSALGTGLDSHCNVIYIDSNDIMYVGGNFTTAGGITTNKIAKYTISTNTWSAIGTGLSSGECYDIAPDSLDNLYFAGWFSTVNGVSGTNNIVKYNKTSNTWTQLGSGLDSDCHTIVVYTDNLIYVGGHFTTAGGVTCNKIALWDGSTWSALGVGLNGTVYSLAINNNNILYAAGTFSNLSNSSLSSPGIIKWDITTSTWSSLSSWGVNNVKKILFVDNELYVASLNRVAKSNNETTLTTILEYGTDSNISSEITDFIIKNNYIYIGGTFYSIKLNNIVRLFTNSFKYNITDNTVSTIDNLTNTSPSINGVCNAIVNLNETIYFGGAFNYNSTSQVLSSISILNTTTNTLSSFNNSTTTSFTLSKDSSGNLYFAPNTQSIQRFNPNNSTITSLSDPFSGGVYAISISKNNSLYVGGNFTSGTLGTRISKYSGSGKTWTALGTGLNDICLTIITDSSENVYAGGDFFTAGGISVYRVAKWDGSSWSALGTGLNSSCYSLAVDTNNNIYAGGFFTTASGITVNRIAKWNGTTWSALGTGLNNTCNGIKIYNNLLYAVGQFTTVNGIATTGLAIYNILTSVWYPVIINTFISGNFTSIELDNNYMYLGGNFFITNGNNPYRNILKLPQPNIATLTGSFIKGTDTSSKLSMNAQETRTLTWNGTQWSIS